MQFFMLFTVLFSEVTVFEDIKARPGDKRRREDSGDPSDIESYKGNGIITLLSSITCRVKENLALFEDP